MINPFDKPIGWKESEMIEDNNDTNIKELIEKYYLLHRIDKRFLINEYKRSLKLYNKSLKGIVNKNEFIDCKLQILCEDYRKHPFEGIDHKRAKIKLFKKIKKNNGFLWYNDYHYDVEKFNELKKNTFLKYWNTERLKYHDNEGYDDYSLYQPAPYILMEFPVYNKEYPLCKKDRICKSLGTEKGYCKCNNCKYKDYIKGSMVHDIAGFNDDQILWAVEVIDTHEPEYCDKITESSHYPIFLVYVSDILDHSFRESRVYHILPTEKFERQKSKYDDISMEDYYSGNF